MTIDQHIAIWNAIGTWLAAIATFSAVALTLWIVVRQEQVRLIVHVTPSRRIPVVRPKILRTGQQRKQLPDEFLMVTVRNLAVSPVTIRALMWQVKEPPSDDGPLWTVVDSDAVEKLPRELKKGQSETFLLTDLDNIAESFRWASKSGDLNSLFFLVVTDGGHEHYVRPHRKALQLIASRVAQDGSNLESK